MWPFKNKQAEEIKQYLIPAIEAVVIELVMDKVRKIIDDWNEKKFRVTKEEGIQAIKSETLRHIQSEEFIDKIVARINNKQLGAK